VTATGERVGEPERASPTMPRRRSATTWVVAGSLASGVGAYAFQVIGTRALGDVAFAPIGVLWTLQYLMLTIALYAVEAYVTRSASADAGGRDLRRGVRKVAGWVVVLAVALTAATYAGRETLFAGVADLAVVAGVLVMSFGAFSIVRGRYAGAHRFRAYGVVTGLESLARLVLALGVALTLPTTRAMAWIMPVGPLLAVALWWWHRSTVRARAPEEGPAAPAPADATQPLASGNVNRFLAATTTANASSQALLASGPLILLPLGAGPAEVAVFFITVTAARAPMAFAFGGLLSRLLPPLVQKAREGDDRALRRVARLVVPASAGLAAVAGLAAWAVGPELVSLLFGPAFVPGRLFTALTVAGVFVGIGALTLNQVLIARGSENRLVLPWLAAVAIAAAVILVVPDTATMRVTYGFVAGEMTAVAGLLAAVFTAPRLAGVQRPQGR
jgi:O-antigen/teichoic acid export membrane protein